MITHPEKLLFPDDGISKGELAAYHATVAPAMLPHLRGRPLTMERYPAGIAAKGFIQKSVTRGFPAWLERIEVGKHGGTVHHPLVNDERALAWMVNQNCVTPHVWNRRVPDLAHPDLCVFDLDPADDDLGLLRRAALALRDLLAERGLPSWIKTSGSKGFHVVVPLDGSAEVEAVNRFAIAIASELVRRDPAHLTREWIKADRAGRLFLDTDRNTYSATFAAAYAVRARPGAPVSAPCTWAEVEAGTIRPQAFTLRTMPARLDAVGDLWADLHARPVALPAG